MDVKTTLPISEARKKIFAIARAVQRPGTVYTFTEKGRPAAVMISAEEFESLIETIEAYRQFPNLDRDSEAAWQDVKAGKAVPLETMLTKNEHVGHPRSKKGAKRNRAHK